MASMTKSASDLTETSMNDSTTSLGSSRSDNEKTEGEKQKEKEEEEKEQEKQQVKGKPNAKGAKESDSEIEELRRDLTLLRHQFEVQRKQLREEEEARYELEWRKESKSYIFSFFLSYINRVEVERELAVLKTKSKEQEENTILDMEKLVRVLQQSLVELKEKLERSDPALNGVEILDDDVGDDGDDDDRDDDEQQEAESSNLETVDE